MFLIRPPSAWSGSGIVKRRAWGGGAATKWNQAGTKQEGREDRGESPNPPASRTPRSSCSNVSMASSRLIDRAPNRRTRDSRKKAQKAQNRTSHTNSVHAKARTREGRRTPPRAPRLRVSHPCPGLDCPSVQWPWQIGTAFGPILRQFTEGEPRSAPSPRRSGHPVNPRLESGPSCPRSGTAGVGERSTLNFQRRTLKWRKCRGRFVSLGPVGDRRYSLNGSDFCASCAFLRPRPACFGRSRPQKNPRIVSDRGLKWCTRRESNPKPSDP